MADKPDVVQSGTQKVNTGSSQALKEKALAAVAKLPPFSPILTRLMASLAGEDASYAKLSELIEKDAVLAGNLLHLVNSALYARRSTINSVRHAVSLLGINKLRNAVLGMSISRMWNQMRMPASWSMARFNQHSAATAVLSDLLAQRLPMSYPEGAFVAGLLHDVGRLLIALSLTDKHDAIQLLQKQSNRSLVECEQEILGFTHPELSSEALTFWKLPEQMGVAVRFHHSVASDPTPPKGNEVLLSRVLDAANQYVNSTGVSILEETGRDPADGSIVENLGLKKEHLEIAMFEFKTEYDAMAQFFT